MLSAAWSFPCCALGGGTLKRCVFAALYCRPQVQELGAKAKMPPWEQQRWWARLSVTVCEPKSAYARLSSDHPFAFLLTVLTLNQRQCFFKQNQSSNTKNYQSPFLLWGGSWGWCVTSIWEEGSPLAVRSVLGASERSFFCSWHSSIPGAEQKWPQTDGPGWTSSKEKTK